MNEDSGPRIVDEPPDLGFVVEGTESIRIPKGTLEEFCPHIEHCPRIDLDSNCFYGKFLHCDEARELEKTYKLSKRDTHFLKYKDIGIGS